MKSTFFSSVSFKFLTGFLIVALALAGLPVNPAFAADTGLNSPTGCTSGAGQWVNPGNATASDNTDAVSNANNEVLVCSFDLPAIPAGNQIDGIEVVIEGSATGSREAAVDLSWDGGFNYTGGDPNTSFGATEATFTLGGATATWNRTWAVGNFTAANFRVRLISNGGTNNIELDHVQVRVTYSLPAEMDVQGNGISIVDGDGTPSLTDGTNWGNVGQGVAVDHVFTIQNTGTGDLTIGAITFTGGNAGDFSVVSAPTSPVPPGGSTTFTVRLTAGAGGGATRDTTVNIVNNDANENPYSFDIEGTRITIGAEIEVHGNAIQIADGDATPNSADGTNFGSVEVGSSVVSTFTIHNFGSTDLTVGAFSFTGDFSLATAPAATVASGDSTTFQVQFTPSALGMRNGTVSFVNNDASENPYNFSLTGTGADTTAPTVTMASAAPDPTNTTPIAVTVQFSETVTGFVVGDITPGNATVNTFVAVDGDTYTFNLVPSGQGLITADIVAGVAQDGAGNNNIAAPQFSRTFDSLSPDTTITANPTTPTSVNAAAFSFTGNDGGGTGVASFECQLDGGGFSACTSPANFSPLADGSHTFQVRAVDGAGNIDPTPASFTWTIDTTAPDTTITSNPTNPTSNSVASFSFTGNDGGSGIASFECQLDGGGFSACTSPQNYIGLSDGAHTFEVRAVDNVGNVDPTPASFIWTVDTTTPGTTITANPTNPSANASASFSFTGTDGGTGVASFECQIDGGGFSACTSPQNYASLSDGSHIFQVRAVDNAGNIDPTPASFTWTIDVTAPDTTITANPTSPSASNAASFSFTGNDVGGTGVASFECQLNGGGFSACTSPQNYSGLSDGAHTFEVRAVDAVGNIDPTPASFNWTIDATTPDTTITSNPTNPSASASASFSFTGTDGGSGVALFECQFDGGGFSACTSPQNYVGLSEGAHTFEVRAVDAVGNVDPTPASFTWTIDTAAPDTTITVNPSDPSASASASFSFSGTDGGSGVASFECQMDGGGFSACASPQNYAGLSDGSHTFQVRAIDNVGNVDASPASFSWTVDTVSPDTTLTATPSDPSADNTPAFSFTGSDPGGSGVASFECQMDGGGFSACNSGDSFGPLSDGSHTFEVRAVDNAGNVDASPAFFTWVVDATAPDTTIDSSPADPDNDTTPTFTFSSTDGTASFECQLGGGGFSACNSGDSFGPLSAGSHTFEVRAVDALGNTDPTPAAFTWTVDTGTPDTTIDSNPPNPSSLADASFTFSSPDADVTGFECQLDGGGFTACTTPRTYLGLSGGSHTFEVRAVDSANNVDPTPAAFTWMIDLGYPTVSGTTPANNASLTTGPIQLVVTFSEDVKNDGSTEAANNTVNYLLVEDGANNTFNTLSCAGGLVADDTPITVNSAVYSNNGGSGPFTAMLNINGGAALPVGTYRLFICGTTSIEDSAGNELNNGVDSILNFTVVQQGSGGGGGGGGNNNNNNNNNTTATGGFLIPVTGFPKNEATSLPAQPASMMYAATDLWLEIPALGLKMSIVGVPKTKTGWDVTWLGRDAGWLNGSAFPTWKGNSVITAHVWDALNQPGPFAKLKDLKYGDQIRIHAFGQVYMYEIRESSLIAPTNTAAMLKPEDKAWLTLITCEDYKEASNSYSYRRMVRAVLVSVVAEK